MANKFFQKPNFSSKKPFNDPEKAVDFARKIYEANTSYLRNNFMALANGEEIPDRVSAHYPYAYIEVSSKQLRLNKADMTLAYGFVSKEGRHFTTLTRPDLFGDYYVKMFGTVMDNHEVPLKVGESKKCPIPIFYAFPEGIPADVNLDEKQTQRMEEVFDLINLRHIDDKIVNNKMIVGNDEQMPLALYTAPRVDYSLQRLSYYTGTDPKHFQKFVLFTNYQFYVDEFRKMAHEIMTKSDDSVRKKNPHYQYATFVEPGNHVFFNQNKFDRFEEGKASQRFFQMPAYHLTREDGNGITLVNINVGPSNAKTITDNIAVLRPHAWIMVGHCGAIRAEMKFGDYVLAHGYDRKDNILDSKLSLGTPIPALAEIQVALQQAARNVLGKKEDEEVVRTGTVVTVEDRNWELEGLDEILANFNQSRPIAIDMESGTIATNGYRHRVPYGTLLSVSDRPLHGAPKIIGSAEKFYRERIVQHIRIGVEACEIMRKNPDKLHSRKLACPFEPAFL